MKVIICGAGLVGANIAGYLAEENNDVTVIDINPELIAQVNDTLDVSGIVGFASHPDVLERAGAHDAEMIIAATYADEVNMVACQIAHTLFNVPKKIARVRQQTYLDPIWANMFSRDHMPIDVVISPEVEVAKALYDRIKVPGVFNIIPLADGQVQLASVICKDDCPVINTPLKHLGTLFPDLICRVVAIARGNKKIIPSDEDEMYPGDEVYFVAATKHFSRAMAAFGHEEPETRRVLIVGAGNIGYRLAKDIQDNHPRLTARVIEADYERAQFVSQNLDKTIVLHGDGLDMAILEEANIGSTEAIIAVMSHDESNVLVSLLAKEAGCERAITLVGRSAYIPIVTSLGINAVVNPRAITVSTILQHIRRGRIKAAHSLRDGFAEILEVEALDTSDVISKPIRNIKIKNVIFGAIVRDDEILVPGPDTVIKPDDRVIILAAHDQVKKVEQMFSVRPEYF